MLENRFTVDVSVPDKFSGWVDEVPLIVIKFLKTLPHVDYRAVGMNFVFSSAKPMEGDAENQLIASMLKEGTWMEQLGGLSGTEIELRYRNGQPQYNVKVGVKESLGKAEGPKEYVVIVNVHHDFEGTQGDERARFIQTLSEVFSAAQAVVSKLPLE